MEKRNKKEAEKLEDKEKVEKAIRRVITTNFSRECQWNLKKRNEIQLLLENHKNYDFSIAETHPTNQNYLIVKEQVVYKRAQPAESSERGNVLIIKKNGYMLWVNIKTKYHCCCHQGEI